MNQIKIRSEWRLYLPLSLLFGVVMGAFSVYFTGAFLMIFSIVAGGVLMFGGQPRKGAGHLRMNVFYTCIISTIIAWAIVLVFSP